MTERQREPATERADARGNGVVRAEAMRTPGVLTFAAIMMFLVGGFQALVAVTGFSGSAYLLGAAGDTFGWGLLVWVIVDSIVAIMALYAGYAILRGEGYGFVFGYFFAILGAIRWLFFIPAAPVLGVVVVVLDILIIYALTKHSDYFLDVG
jgi:hypothetical protein